MLGVEEPSVRDRASGLSPEGWARVGGLLYLVIFVTAFAAMGIESKVVVENNAAATAGHIIASQTLWRTAIALQVLMYGCDFALAAILYVLLRPVSAGMSLMAAFFRLGEAVIGTLTLLWQFTPLFLLGGSPYLKVFAPEQLQAFALLSVKLFDRGFAIALVPFGIHCALVGYLIFKARYFPKTLGVLLGIGGAGYVVNSLAIFTAPAISDLLFPWILLPGFFAEVGLCLWLIFVGVNIPKWNERIASLGLASQANL